MDRIGIVGAGEAAAPVVRLLAARGLAVAVAVAPGPDSPREGFASSPGIRVADPQDAVDASDIVILCGRSDQAGDAVARLPWRADHRIVSLMATVPMTRLAAFCSPARRIVRAFPLGMFRMSRPASGGGEPPDPAEGFIGVQMAFGDPALADSLPDVLGMTAEPCLQEEDLDREIAHQMLAEAVMAWAMEWERRDPAAPEAAIALLERVEEWSDVPATRDAGPATDDTLSLRMVRELRAEYGGSAVCLALDETYLRLRAE